MENKLVELRKQIDEIDEEMAKLFVKRMKVVYEVGEYKRQNNLPILDSSREDIVLEKGKRLVPDEVLSSYYQEFLIDLMNISKKYQNKK